MLPVACPSCGEKGNIPEQAIGKRIKCHKCGVSFVAGATTAAPTASKAAGDTIEVDGLDPSIWAASAVAVEAHALEQPQELLGPSPAPAGSPQGPEQVRGPVRQYKVLTQKDRWFGGKFELGRLEEALNHYAREGWVVRSMATPLVTGFSGGPREEILVLLER